MWFDLLIVSLWGGVVSSDTTAAFQFMISHPIVSCAVVGLLLGNFALGFSIGIILELVWLNEIPAGAAKFSEGNVGATVAAASAILTVEQTARPIPSIVLSLFVAVVVSMIAGRLVILMRSLNGKIFDRLMEREHITIAAVQRAHLQGLALAFLMGLVVTAVSLVALAPFVLPWLVSLIPIHLEVYLQPVVTAFIAVGCGVLFYLFKDHKYWWLVFVGLGVGIVFYYLL